MTAQLTHKSTVKRHTQLKYSALTVTTPHNTKYVALQLYLTESTHIATQNKQNKQNVDIYIQLS